jgi:DNA-binding transcriptional ArsR family regulator
MVDKPYKEMLEKLEKIEEKLNTLSERVDDLAESINSIFEISGGPGLLKSVSSKDFREILASVEDVDTGPHKKPLNPWTMKSIGSFSKGRKINVNIGVLADPQTLLPTLRALKSNPDGLTAEEVSNITKRSRATEANYLSKMFKLGILDKTKVGKNAQYRLSDKMIPPSIRHQI